MKKFLLLVLCLALVCVFAACGNANETPETPAEEEEPEVEWIPTPTDLEILMEDIEMFGTNELPANQQAVGDMAQISEKLGEEVYLPKDYEVIRTTILNDEIVQVEFKIGDIAYTGRYAKGLRENMSGMSSNLVENKTEKIGDISVQLRYTTEEQAQPGFSSSLGVADAYDATKNISYMVVQMHEVTQESLLDAMMVLMESLGREPEPEPEPEAEAETETQAIDDYVYDS